MEEIIFDHPGGGVAWITLNRPDAMNAMSSRLRAKLADALADAEADDAIGAIVLTGAGKAFSAGLDLKELGQDRGALSRVGDDDPRSNTVLAIDRCTKPVIAAINGICVTGALEVALACDIMIAGESARFADTHAKVGLAPVWGLSQRLSRLIGPGRAREMSLSARFIDAGTADRWGLVSRVVADAALSQESLELARSIAANDRASVRINKALMKRGFEMTLGEGLAHEMEQGTEFNARANPEAITERRKALLGH